MMDTTAQTLASLSRTCREAQQNRDQDPPDHIVNNVINALRRHYKAISEGQASPSPRVDELLEKLIGRYPTLPQKINQALGLHDL